MKFSLRGQTLKQVVAELLLGLLKLDLVDNFQSWETDDLTIDDQTGTPGDYKIKNELSPTIPTRMIIVKQTGNALVTAGDTAWTSNFVYIKNNSTTTDAIVRIIFQR